MNFTLGADPEMFLTKQGAFVSSVGRVGGSKEHPLPLPIGKGFAIQEDNVAVEFNIPPADNINLFTENIQTAVNFIRKGISNMGLELSQSSAVSFPVEELQTPQAAEFGCTPDYNAWAAGEQNTFPVVEDKTLRSCGGHIHIGFDQEKVSHLDLIRYCDLFLGVPSVLMDKEGSRRRVLYGKPGAFRRTSFGVEYRTLSNFWIFKPELCQWAGRNVERALHAAVAQLALSQEDSANIVQAINGNNTELANQLVAKFELEVV